MALLSQQLQSSLLARADGLKSTTTTTAATNCCGKRVVLMSQWRSSSSRRPLRCRCSAIALDSPGSMSGVTGIRLGSVKLQGAREEMEDDLVVVKPDTVDGFSFAAVLDGHGGSSSVQFIRDELYKECSAALQGDLLLRGKDFNTIKAALAKAFMNLDARLSDQLEEVNGVEDESGATATVIFVGKNMLFTAHIGDSSVVLSRSGKPEVLTSPHRPYGSNKASLQEIKRIREAGGWISNGRICGDIAVSRAFGDIRFKTKKTEMLRKGVEEGRWTQKFISRVRFSGDLVSACPDIFQVALGPDTEFLILASDGLWDYINSLEAVDFVRNQLRQHGNVQQACESLARAALDRRSQDNISIVIADLGKTAWQSLPEEKQNVLYEFGQALATVGVVALGIWVSSQLSV